MTTPKKLISKLVPDEVGTTHYQEMAFVFDNTAGLGYPLLAENLLQGKQESYFQIANFDVQDVN